MTTQTDQQTPSAVDGFNSPLAIAIADLLSERDQLRAKLDHAIKHIETIHKIGTDPVNEKNIAWQDGDSLTIRRTRNLIWLIRNGEKELAKVKEEVDRLKPYEEDALDVINWMRQRGLYDSQSDSFLSETLTEHEQELMRTGQQLAEANEKLAEQAKREAAMREALNRSKDALHYLNECDFDSEDAPMYPDEAEPILNWLITAFRAKVSDIYADVTQALATAETIRKDSDK